MSFVFNKEMGINKWVDMFRSVYFSTQNYRRSSADIFVNLTKVVGGAANHMVRNLDQNKSKEYLAKIFAWYCALSVRQGIDLEDVLWRKYPGLCPRCLKPTCECVGVPLEIDAEKLSMLALERVNQKPQSLREWQAMFQNIYRAGPSGKIVISSGPDRITKIFSRFTEELGEVAETILMDPVIDNGVCDLVGNEMADLCAWIFSIANNLHCIDSTAHGIFLADVVWDYYPGKCHRCNESKCVCVRGSYGAELAEKGAMGPSHWDERTGLANSKALDRYNSYMKRCFYSGEMQWSVLFFDLDNFGLINKTYGHENGDFILNFAAKCISGSIGDKGVVFRRGGEEFIAILKTQHRESLYLAECARRCVKEGVVIKFNGVDNLIDVTVSVGVASCGFDGNKVDQLESIADKYCREAKASGKDRVIPSVSKDIIDEFISKSMYMV